jgi:hypothetical protein
MLASVKLMFGLAADIPKVNAPIVMADGPLFVKSMSSELPDEPAVAKTDWPDKITPECAVAGPRRKKAPPHKQPGRQWRMLFRKTCFRFHLALQPCLFCQMYPVTNHGSDVPILVLTTCTSLVLTTPSPFMSANTLWGATAALLTPTRSVALTTPSSLKSPHNTFRF